MAELLLSSPINHPEKDEKQEKSAEPFFPIPIHFHTEDFPALPIAVQPPTQTITQRADLPKKPKGLPGKKKTLFKIPKIKIQKRKLKSKLSKEKMESPNSKLIHTSNWTYRIGSQFPLS